MTSGARAGSGGSACGRSRGKTQVLGIVVEVVFRCHSVAPKSQGLGTARPLKSLPGPTWLCPSSHRCLLLPCVGSVAPRKEQGLWGRANPGSHPVSLCGDTGHSLSVRSRETGIVGLIWRGCRAVEKGLNDAGTWHTAHALLSGGFQIRKCWPTSGPL